VIESAVLRAMISNGVWTGQGTYLLTSVATSISYPTTFQLLWKLLKSV